MLGIFYIPNPFLNTTRASAIQLCEKVGADKGDKTLIDVEICKQEPEMLWAAPSIKKAMRQNRMWKLRMLSFSHPLASNLSKSEWALRIQMLNILIKACLWSPNQLSPLLTCQPVTMTKKLTVFQTLLVRMVMTVQVVEMYQILGTQPPSRECQVVFPCLLEVLLMERTGWNLKRLEKRLGTRGWIYESSRFPAEKSRRLVLTGENSRAG